MTPKKVIYYSSYDEDFSKAVITPRKIGDDYVYVRTSLFSRISAFLRYRLIAAPLAFLYLKIKFGRRIVNKKALKSVKDSGYFIFSNHTQDIGDAVSPAITAYPRRVYVIVHPDNVSMPFLGKITPLLGALPLPDTKAAAKNFFEAIKTRLEEKCAVAIYPEAHIWPYCTKIRPFKSDSFRYPVRFDLPVFCVTNTYKKRKLSKKPKMISYVDGPFYPDKSLSYTARAGKLCTEVYECMCHRAENSDCEYVEYRPIEEKPGTDITKG